MPQPRRVEERSTAVDLGAVRLSGDLAVPERPEGLVLFAHGSGSGRLSPRNRSVAQVLQQAGFVTLLVDLLTADEEEVDRLSTRLRFDIRLLADRVVAITDWVARQASLRELPLGYFGASTGAAAALVAAAERPAVARAVVSRGGRPDLAATSLPLVHAPTLLMVGGQDGPVLPLNKAALASLTELASEQKQLTIVPGATHLFEEPGALEEVARLSADWFTRYLRASQSAAR